MDNFCLICERTNLLETDFYRINDEFASCSGKALKLVLSHILRCTQINLETLPDSTLCSKCYTFLLEYDEHVVKLMSLQKRFKFIYDNPINTKKILSPTLKKRKRNLKTIRITDESKSNDSIIEESKDEFEEAVSLDGNIIDLNDKKTGEETEEKSEDSEDPNECSEQSANQVQCKYCAQYFKNRGRLRKHISEMHIIKESKCAICNLLLKDEEYLELHMNLHEGKTEYDCRYCDKRFTHKSSVIRHMQKHWDKKKYQCEKCGLRFSETPRLYNHKLLHESEENPLICHICNQKCKTRRTYKRHMNTHQEDRQRYPCHICGKTFSEKFTLKPHLRTHEGYTDPKSTRNKTMTTINNANDGNNASSEAIESFNCIICGNSFNSKEQHKKHMQNEHDVITWDT